MLQPDATPPEHLFSPLVLLIAAAIGALATWLVARASPRAGPGCGCLTIIVVLIIGGGTTLGVAPGVLLVLLYSIALLAMVDRMRGDGSAGGGFAAPWSRSRAAQPTEPRPRAYRDDVCSGCGSPFDAQDARCRYCGRART